MKNRKHRQFSTGFKQAMVLLYSNDPAKRSMNAFCKAYDISWDSLALWVRQEASGVLTDTCAVAFSRKPQKVKRVVKPTKVKSK